MYEEFTQDRISKLRMKRGVSARDMSLSLGQNDTYINKIENKKAMPSLQGLFYICEFFGVTPEEFFSESTENPVVLKEIIDNLKRLDDDLLFNVASIVRELSRSK